MNTITTNSLKEVTMRVREKVLILLVAICVSVLGFNLIASSSVCLLKAGKESGYEPIQNYLAKCEGNYERIEYSSRKLSKPTQLNMSLQLPLLKASFLDDRGDSFLRKTLRIIESVSSF